MSDTRDDVELQESVEGSSSSTQEPEEETKPYVNLEEKASADNKATPNNDVEKADKSAQTSSTHNPTRSGIEGLGMILNEDGIDDDDEAERDLLGTLKAFFLPDKGHEISYAVGILIDVVALVIWVSLVVTLVPNDFIKQHWYMPLVGILGSTVAMATPAGGGIVYFPVIATIAVSASQATSFAFAVQLFGMGLFGAVNWIRKARNVIVWWVVGVTTLFGWIGSILSTFAFPINNDVLLECMFAGFCFLLIIYVLWGLIRGNLRAQDAEMPFNVKAVLACAVTGLIGGIVLGWIAVGIDVFIFLVLTAFYGMDSRRATVISILIIGWGSILPFFIHMFYKKSVPVYYWALTLGGCVIGARVGSLINILIGKRVMLISFVVLLVAEICRVIAVYAVIPSMTRSTPIHGNVTRL